jgi:galactitol-specific phosphotransferase system IIC component
LNGVGWAVLGFAVIFPVVVFAVAFALGRRRGAAALAVILLVGLALVAVFWLDVLAYSSITDSLLNPVET